MGIPGSSGDCAVGVLVASPGTEAAGEHARLAVVVGRSVA